MPETTTEIVHERLQKLIETPEESRKWSIGHLERFQNDIKARGDNFWHKYDRNLGPGEVGNIDLHGAGYDGLIDSYLYFETLRLKAETPFLTCVCQMILGLCFNIYKQQDKEDEKSLSIEA